MLIELCHGLVMGSLMFLTMGIIFHYLKMKRSLDMGRKSVGEERLTIRYKMGKEDLISSHIPFLNHSVHQFKDMVLGWITKVRFKYHPVDYY